jgi:ribonucleoside-triphosphate reductase
MGGRASGPEPLVSLHKFCRQTIQNAAGRKLTDVEWLDIGNMIADCVVVGGVRRSAEISFSDRNSPGMRHAKDVPCPPHRFNSNNTATYKGRPSLIDFMEEWAALAKSGTGERGIFNLEAALKHMPKRRKQDKDIRGNPCLEILLRNQGVCNLSEVVVRAGDEFDDLVQKVETAVWIGVIQSTLTHFPNVSKGFIKNAEEERLLGVSLTGQFDNPKLLTDDRLGDLKKYATKVAKRASETLGINMPAAVTCVKPSGTVSQLVNSASGAHPRYAPYYIRRYRIAATDPLYRMMRDQGVEFSPENGQEKWPDKRVTTWVCEFPIASPKGAVTRNDLTAIQQLEWYLKLQKNWSEHNVSITCYVGDEEWLDVGAWVYAHFDELVAVSFLPRSDSAYKLAPYEEVTEVQYAAKLKAMPIIDYSNLSKYELEDQGEGSREYACVSGACEL